MSEPTLVKIEVFVPEDALAAVCAALAEAGAGRVGRYDHCFSMTQVHGTWRPLPGAQPYDGTVGQISEGDEIKLETNCAVEDVSAAVTAIRRVHPYEEPLINIIPLLNSVYGGAV